MGEATKASRDPRVLPFCIFLREAWPATPAVCSNHSWQDHLWLPFFLHSPVFPLLGAEACLWGGGLALDAQVLDFVPSVLLLGAKLPPGLAPKVPALTWSLGLAFGREIASPHLLPAHPLSVLSSVPRNSAGLSSVIACAPWLAHTDVLNAHLRVCIPLSCIGSVGLNTAFPVLLRIQ